MSNGEVHPGRVVSINGGDLVFQPEFFSWLRRLGISHSLALVVEGDLLEPRLYKYDDRPVEVWHLVEFGNVTPAADVVRDVYHLLVEKRIHTDIKRSVLFASLAVAVLGVAFAVWEYAPSPFAKDPAIAVLLYVAGYNLFLSYLRADDAKTIIGKAKNSKKPDDLLREGVVKFVPRVGNKF